MPSLGTDMESGTLVEWLKKPGDPVHRGDVVAIIETEKGAIEVEIFVDGVMGQPLVPLGASVPVGTPLAVIEEKGAAAPVAPVAGSPVPPATVPQPAAGVPRPAASAAIVPGGRASPVSVTRASPAARKAAQERGIDLAGLQGSGPGGAVTTEDVARAAAPETPAARPGLDLDKMRIAIAAAMAHSKREIPHYYLKTEIDMLPAQQWLETVNASRPPETRLIPAVLMLKAIALALR